MDEEIEQRELDIVGWWVIYDERDEPIAVLRSKGKADDYAMKSKECVKWQILEVKGKK